MHSGIDAKLQTLASGGVISHAIRTLTAGGATINSVAISSSALRLLTSFCRGSPTLTLNILADGICGTLASILGADSSAGSIASQLDKNDVISLVLELLPRLPPDVSPLSSGRGMFAIPTQAGRQAHVEGASKSTTATVIDEKERLLTLDHPEQIVAIGEAILGSLIERMDGSVAI
jgi:hypothetical protein